MQVSISGCIKFIDAYLQNLNRYVVKRLRPGLPEGALKEALAVRNLSIPDGLASLYACHDGINLEAGDSLDDAHYFPGFYWLSSGDALRTYDAVVRDSRWNDSWIPIFGNGGGDFFAVCCDAAESDFGSVIGFRVGDIEQPIQFDSVLSMMRSLQRCYELGVYFVSEGFLEADDLKADLIAKEFNPGLAYYER